MNDLWKMEKKNIMPTYGRKDICLVSGKGAYVWDTEGKKYLDFVSGVAVNSFGHCDAELVASLAEQGQTLMHISNLYWNPEQLKLAEKLIRLSKGAFEAAFFCNSGTEAVETAIKIARKHGAGQNKRRIMYFTGSFHGRTTGALSVTSEGKYRRPFLKEEEETSLVSFNSIDELEKQDFSQVCGIILEPIQGEGGITPCHEAFIKRVKELSIQHNCLLVYDEVQCGIGRTGYFFASDFLEVEPDIVCLAKGLGGGFPIGAVLVNNKANVLDPGDHGSTFGGNPLACAVANRVVSRLEKDETLIHVKEASLYMRKKLHNISLEYPSIIEEVRGVGLLMGLKLTKITVPDDLINLSRDMGLLLVGASGNVIRLLPPLNVTFDEIDEMCLKLTSALKLYLGKV